jgi:hypothetical protein
VNPKLWTDSLVGYRVQDDEIRPLFTGNKKRFPAVCCRKNNVPFFFQIAAKQAKQPRFIIYNQN